MNNKAKIMDAKIIICVVLSMLVLIAYISLYTDYRYFFLSLTAGVNEEKALKRNEHFTGKAYYKGDLEGDIVVLTGESLNYKYGIRITRYKNGLKDGKEKLYKTHERGGYFNLAKQTLLHSITHYRNGELHGKKTIYYAYGGIAIEANYANGKLHGVYQEVRFPERIVDYRWEPNEKYPNYAYYHRGKRIPIKKEIQYTNGEIDGFYRTYKDNGDTMDDYIMTNGSIVSGVRQIDVSRSRAEGYTRNAEGEWTDRNGNIVDDSKAFTIRFSADGKFVDRFTIAEDSITNGLRWIASEYGDEIGFFIKEYYRNGEITEQISYKDSHYEFPAIGLLNSLFYENGEITDYSEYDYYRTDDGDYKNYHTLRKKRINGEMVEIYNRKTGLNRLEEFVD